MIKNDIIGYSVVKYFIEDFNIQLRVCVLFERLFGDNVYFLVNCLKWGNNGICGECEKWGSFKNKGSFCIYNDLIFWEGKYYVNIKFFVLVCDDLYSFLVFLFVGDIWQVFVC